MQNLESRSDLDDVDVAVLARQEYFSVVGPRRRAESARLRISLTPINLLAGLGIMAGEKAAGEEAAQLIAIDDRRGQIGGERGIRPCDEFVTRFTFLERDIAVRAWSAASALVPSAACLS